MLKHYNGTNHAGRVKRYAPSFSETFTTETSMNVSPVSSLSNNQLKRSLLKAKRRRAPGCTIDPEYIVRPLSLCCNNASQRIRTSII